MLWLGLRSIVDRSYSAEERRLLDAIVSMYQDTWNQTHD
jgi:hypothetical protein